MTIPTERDPTASQEQHKEHFAWRRRISLHLPALAQRTFALRSTSYSGSAFHYGLERELGRVIAFVNNYNEPITITDLAIDEIVFERFLRSLIRAELSACGTVFVSEAARNAEINARRGEIDVLLSDESHPE